MIPNTRFAISGSSNEVQSLTTMTNVTQEMINKLMLQMILIFFSTPINLHSLVFIAQTQIQTQQRMLKDTAPRSGICQVFDQPAGAVMPEGIDLQLDLLFLRKLVDMA